MFNSYDEIFKQGEVLKKTYDYVLSQKDKILDFFKGKEFDEIVFIACGSSYWLSKSACMTMQNLTGKKSTAIKSGEIVLNPKYYEKAFKNPLVIAPSRSGTTEETLIAVNLFKKTYNSAVLTIVEYENSPFEELADFTLKTPWANEISVCQTRSFSSLYLSCIMIASIISGNNKLIDEVSDYLDNFDALSKNAEEGIKKIIKDFKECANLVTLGCSYQYGVVIEGAYIVIEMTSFPSNYYSLLEYRHGPIVMADNTYLVAVFASAGNSGYELKMALDAKKKGAKILSITCENKMEAADFLFSYGKPVSDEVLALYGIMVMQGFAHFKAIDLSVDPDNPKGLVPYITINK